MTLLALVAWLYLLLLHGRFWQSGPVLESARPQRAPPVAVIVPARDEAEVIARSIGSLLAQDYAGPMRIVLVDDRSSDGTGDVARRLAGIGQRLTVISGAPRRAGWTGKLWAVQQGVEATDEDILLLTDADVVHDPAHLASLVAQLERTSADLVSEMVALNCESLGERALVPAFVNFFALLYPFEWVNDPMRATAAAAGGTILIRRRALDRIGGLGSIRGALIDDVALARAVKCGGRIWLGHSVLARSIRRYPGFADLWNMIARSAYVQLRHSPAFLALTIIGMAWLFLLPVSATLLHPHWIGLAAWILMAVSFMPTLRRFNLASWWAPLLPATAAFYMAATIGSAISYHTGRGAVWKGRTYGGTRG
jgi:hopene-associated glycosyltransferase HpnB